MRFEELKVWQESRKLYNNLSDVFDNDFKDYFFRTQILRAALSISNNIAEGFERETNKELKRFLYISKGSAGEVRSMLYLSLDKGYINEEIFETLIDRCNHISIMVYKYLSSIKY